MDWNAQRKLILDDLHLRKFFTGWLRSAILAAIFSAVALLNEAGPLAIALVAANVGLLSFFVFDRAKNKKAASVTAFGLVLVGLIALAWSVWQTHKQAAQYHLVVDSYNVLRSGKKLPNGEGQVTGINGEIDLGNQYTFPLYYRINRQFAKINGRSSRFDNPGATILPLEERHAISLGSDSVPAVLENGKYHEVQVDFEVDYGRSKKLQKRFHYSASWQFFLCPISGNICGPITSTGEKITNTRISEEE